MRLTIHTDHALRMLMLLALESGPDRPNVGTGAWIVSLAGTAALAWIVCAVAKVNNPLLTELQSGHSSPAITAMNK